MLGVYRTGCGAVSEVGDRSRDVPSVGATRRVCTVDGDTDLCADDDCDFTYSAGYAHGFEVGRNHAQVDMATVATTAFYEGYYNGRAVNESGINTMRANCEARISACEARTRAQVQRLEAQNESLRRELAAAQNLHTSAKMVSQLSSLLRRSGVHQESGELGEESD